MGQEQDQGGEGKPLASRHDPPAQSSKSPVRDYSGVNVTTLRTALRKRQLSMQGTRQDLIARLGKSDEDNKLAAATAHSGLAPDTALLCVDTVSNSAATAAESTTEDSTMSQEVGDTNDPVGVEVASSTAGEEGNLVVMTVSGVSKAPGEDEGKNGEAACAHSEVAVTSVTEVADAGEPLLPQLITSSTADKVPPLNLATLQTASPPTIRLTSPPGSSHSSDKSTHEGTEHGTVSVSPSDASPKAQGHNSAGEISIFTTPGEVPPISMTKLSTDIEDLRTELRTRDAEMADRCFAIFTRSHDCLEAIKLRTEHALASQRRAAPPLVEGNLVLLSTKNLRLKYTHAKLLPTFVGPFAVLKPPSNSNKNPNSVWLQTPITLRIHMSINVKDVLRYISRPKHLGGAPSFDAPLPVTVDGYVMWEVQALLSMRTNKRTRCKEALVLWQGFGVESASWEPVANLPKGVLDAYYALQKQAAALFEEQDDNSEYF